MSETTTTATGPAWGTWKDHGHAEALIMLGRDRKAPSVSTGAYALIETHNGGIYVKIVDDGIAKGQSWYCGVAGRFWARPVTDADRKRHGVSTAKTCDECFAPEGEEHEEYCSSTDTEESTMAAKPAKTPKPAKAEKDEKPVVVPVNCKCGCGEVTGKGSLFRQGHDARLVSKLASKVAKGETTREDAIKSLQPVSAKLAAKLIKALDNAAAKAVKVVEIAAAKAKVAGEKAAKAEAAKAAKAEAK